nr:unnamed protein product [Callosobruchus analis]
MQQNVTASIIICIRGHCKKNPTFEKDSSSLKLLEFIVKHELLDSLPNLTLFSVRFCFTLCVSAASCEWSFSNLRLIKNHLRRAMSQAHLLNLAILGGLQVDVLKVCVGRLPLDSSCGV